MGSVLCFYFSEACMNLSFSLAHTETACPPAFSYLKCQKEKSQKYQICNEKHMKPSSLRVSNLSYKSAGSAKKIILFSKT